MEYDPEYDNPRGGASQDFLDLLSSADPFADANGTRDGRYLPGRRAAWTASEPAAGYSGGTATAEALDDETFGDGYDRGVMRILSRPRGVLPAERDAAAAQAVRMSDVSDQTISPAELLRLGAGGGRPGDSHLAAPGPSWGAPRATPGWSSSVGPPAGHRPPTAAPTQPSATWQFRCYSPPRYGPHGTGRPAPLG